MPVEKINFKKLVADLKAEVVAIDASDAEQREKTRRIQAAGQKFRNALYNDQRKYRGKAGKARRISLNTYNTYLSRARKAFEEMGLRHHLLDRELERLQKRYPHHAAVLATMVGLPPTGTRLAKKALEEQLRGAADVHRKLSSLDFSKPSAKRAVDQLRKAHPAYGELLAGLLGKDAQAAEATLSAALDEVDPLLEDLAGLKVNHEIMYALRMEKGLRSTHTERKEKALGVKKRTAIAIHYPHYLQRVASLLANPTVTSGDGTMFGMAPLTFALCAATGRRPIEVLVQGEFRPVKLSGGKVDPHRLAFSGQAKKRSADPDEERIIYTLVDSATVLTALRHLRALPQVADLPLSEGVENDTRSLNAIINSRVGAPLNKFAKDFFADKHRTVKDARSIYARICHELWFRRDPRWRKSDEDVFFAELLGHEDETTQMHYKQFKVLDCDPDFEPDTEQRAGRLQRLAEYDEQMPDLANGDAAVKIHNAVKAQLEKDPDTKITQSVLIKLTGAYRPLIQRYMELCAEALGIERQDNGRWKQLDEAEPEVLVEVEVDEESEESIKEEAEEVAREQEDEAKPSAPAPTSKPRITYDKAGDRWRAAVLLDGVEVSHALDSDRDIAARVAWEEYQEAVDAEPV